MSDQDNTVHPCGIVGEHVGECLECGKHAELGWAHVCYECWCSEKYDYAGLVVDP